ncbi:MAG: hypothetical protein ACFFDQ_14255, partial [Candidatus Thorarchaeota archaeon]
MKQNKMRILTVVVCLTLSLSLFGPVIAAPKSSNTFVVAPSGDTTGITDTANIQQAIDDVVTAGKGTVFLEEGDFYLCETLVGVNFDGTFRGAGAGETVLHSIEDFPALDPANQGSANPRLIMFYQDEYSTSTEEDPYKIELCDFTVNIDKPPEAWYFDLFRAINTIDILGIAGDGYDDDVISYFDVTCKGLEFLGDVGEEYGLFGNSIQNAIMIQGEWEFLGWEYGLPNEKISGNFVIERCHFENSLGSGAVVGQSVDSHIQIVRNKYVNTMVGPEVWDLSNSHVEIAFNDVMCNGWYGVYVANGLYASSLEPSRVSIHHNYIECAPGVTGIWIDDYLAAAGDVEGVSVFAHHNEIVMDDPNCMGVFGFGADDVWLMRNTISGTGMAGIVTGVGDMFYGVQDDVSGWKMVLNDLSDLTADVAAIWLGPGTHDCWLLHRGPSSSVLDEGTDNRL